MNTKNRFRGLSTVRSQEQCNTAFILMGLISLLVASLIVPATAAARSYRVELVIFENTGEPVQEHPDPQSPSYRAAQQQHMKSLSKARTLKNPKGLNRLGGVYSKLNANGRYRILKTLSWYQRSASYAYSPLVNVSNPSEQLNGTVRVYAPNLLFAELNLQFSPQLLPQPGTAGASTSTQPPLVPASSGTSAAWAPRNDTTRATPVFLQEKRRMKLNEVHYFDHSRFGAVLTVSPLN